MHVHVTPGEIALRLVLAACASFFVGLNRDEQGHPAGVRTTMLVCLAATLAMLQVNLLLPMDGKQPGSFIQNDLMRLPLGILDGIGFIGAGVILKREQRVSGVTTAATIWYVTVLGLLFGGGQIRLGCVAAVAAIVILWVLKRAENWLPRERNGRLCLSLDAGAPSEEELRRQIVSAGYCFATWNPTYNPGDVLSKLECTVRWRDRVNRNPQTPSIVERLRTLPGVRSVSWNE